MRALELDFLTRVAKGAGEIAMRHFRKAPEYWHKGDGQGRVSVADIEVDTYLHEEIGREFPNDAILSEERASDAARLANSRVWIIDPIDGTEAFLNGQKFFTTSLALVENGVPVVGLVYAPASDRLYTAVRGEGAFYNGKAIKVCDVAGLLDAKILASGARYNREMIQQEPALDLHFRPSIALRLALIAQGKFHASFAMRASWEWDLAAGILILQEAGGLLTDGFGKVPKFNSDPPQIDGMIAGTPKLVHELIKRNLANKE